MIGNMKIYLLILQCWYLTVYATDQKNLPDCKNAGKIDKNSQTCLCNVGYIGNQCQFSAIPLEQKQTPINLTKTFKFAYFQPKDVTFFRLQIKFCEPRDQFQNDDPISIQFFVQEETFEGTFLKEPMDKKDPLIEFQLSKQQNCISFLTKTLISLRQKQNGETPKIIFGLRIANNTEPEQLVINAQCLQQEMFGLKVIRNAGFFFIICTLVATLASAIYTIKKKYEERRDIRRKNQKFKELTESIMPQLEIQAYLAQNKLEKLNQNCTICLCQYQKKQKIRITPCNHIFHQQCIDSWCKSQMNCPICRHSFDGKDQEQYQEQQQQQQHHNDGQIQIEMIEQRFREQNTENMRQRML